MKSNRKFQFGLKSILIAIVAVSFLATWKSRADWQRNLIKEIEAVGGVVNFSDEIDDEGIPIVANMPPKAPRPSFRNYTESIAKISFTYNYLNDSGEKDTCDVSRELWSKISRLRNLKHLQVIHQEVKDFDLISKLESLETLKLNFSSIQSIESMGELSNLRILGLRGCTVTDLKPIGELKKLRKLDIIHMTAQDLEPLKGCTELKSLDARAVQANSWSFLSSLPELESLNLPETNIEDLGPLIGLTKLTVLDLDDCQVSDLEPIRLLNLERLSIDETEVAELRPLSGHSNLESISFSNTHVDNVGVLLKLGKLQRVVIGKNDPVPSQFEELKELIRQRRKR